MKKALPFTYRLGQFFTLSLLLLVGSLPAARAAGPPVPTLANVLTPAGLPRTDARGSFSATGYQLRTNAAGQPVIRPTGLLGAGDAGWSAAFRTGPDGPVTSLALDGQGNLYVGGAFTHIGALAVNYVAKWNGASWSTLGTGPSFDVNALVLDGSGTLYVGGNFTAAGGVAASNVARWNGTSWASLGAGVSGSVSALALDGRGNLYAGGTFNSAGGVAARNVAKWNGTSWSSLNYGVSEGVLALLTDSSNNLYAGGYFTDAGGVPANYVAK